MTKKNSHILPAGMKRESNGLPNTTTNNLKTNKLQNTKRLFWLRGRRSWSCRPNWFRRSSGSSARGDQHSTLVTP